MIRELDSVLAYQWSGIQREWIKIGTVVDAVSHERGRKMFDGKEWDYVFDVELDNGGVKLKLPYNSSGILICHHRIAVILVENPYAAAQRFIHRNDLNPSYLDQIVQFITRNTGGVELGAEPFSSTDPFTGIVLYMSCWIFRYVGTSRYIPASSSHPVDANVSTESTKPNRILPVVYLLSCFAGMINGVIDRTAIL